jgi:hypothetical protein
VYASLRRGLLPDTGSRAGGKGKGEWAEFVWYTKRTEHKQGIDKQTSNTPPVEAEATTQGLRDERAFGERVGAFAQKKSGHC